MIHSTEFTALLDANVLYPAPLRDILLQLAYIDLYQPKWTDLIQEEWMSNLLLNREDLDREQLERTKHAMNSAFPDASIEGYESLVAALSLPDPDDRHVLAAAIESGAQVIVTFNLKHFPMEQLKPFEIEAQDPDTFISHIIEFDRPGATLALHNQVSGLSKPPQTLEQVLATLEKNRLPKSVALWRE